MILYITQNYKVAVRAGMQGTYDIVRIGHGPENTWEVVANRDHRIDAEQTADREEERLENGT